jgi:uncharacterized protein
VNRSTRLQLRVLPGVARAGVVGRYGVAWKVRVSAPASKGQANKALLDLLARTLGMPRHDLEIIAGHGTRTKTVAFAEITPHELDCRFASAAGISPC